MLSCALTRDPGFESREQASILADPHHARTPMKKQQSYVRDRNFDGKIHFKACESRILGIRGTQIRL
jgi:hypothetical protein